MIRDQSGARAIANNRPVVYGLLGPHHAAVNMLIPCVHDVTPRHFERLVQIDDALRALGLAGRYRMLVVPNFWFDWPLADHPKFCDWLRARADEGVEMLLHGYFHKDTTEHEGMVARLKAQQMTASEGEFLGLSEGDARERIQKGRDEVEAVLGKSVDGFVAPAWLYSEGTHQVLKDFGFRIAEDHLKVWDPTTGKTLSRSPVISYASRTKGRIASSMAWSRIGTATMRALPVVRHAIHPHDFDVPMLEHEISRSLRSLLRRHDPAPYAQLLQ